jgi:hypothetical protein
MVVVLCVAVCSIWVAAAHAEAGSGSTSGEGGALSGSLVTPGSPVEGEQSAAQEQAKLSSPEAVAAREASRTKFEGLNAGQAASLDGEAFPAVVDDPAGGPPKLPAGQSIVGYSTDNVAQVDLPEGKHAVIESLAPMALEMSGGKHVPVDLGLSETGGGFESKNPVVGVRIPKSLGAGLQLPAVGVSLTPVNAQGAALSGSEGTLDGASVLYANTLTDSDTVVKPTTEGFEADMLLRSVESPQQLLFRVGLPTGASLVAAKDGSGDVEVVSGQGATIATVLPPGAQDAASTAVPVSMSVSGDTLALSVADHAAEYQYPVEVDPTIIDNQLVESNGERAHWEWHAEPSGDFKEVRGSSYLETQGAGEYAEKNWAAWAYETHGDSKIFDVSTKTGPAKNKEAKVESYLELEHAEGNKKISEEKEGKGVEEARTEISNESKEPEYTEKGVSVCPDNSKKEQECLPALAHEKNAVVFEQAATGSPKGHKFEDRLDEAFVSISEPAGQHATASFNKTKATYEKIEVEEGGHKVEETRPNALYGSGAWLSKAKTGAVLGLIGEDKGIGFDDTKLEYESSPGKWELISSCAERNYRKGTECHKETKCEGVQCYEKYEETWLLESKLPNGEDKVRYRAEEAMEGTESPASEDEVAVKVDTSKPRSIYLGGLPYGSELIQKVYKFTAYATDGEGSTIPSSGIASLAVFMENSKGEKKEITKMGGTGECSVSKGECTASAEYTINGAELGAGHHGIVIEAKDRAGNEGREEEQISIRHSTPVPMGPGDVDLESGDFTLGPTDVPLGGGLSVSRVYSSRDVTAGTEEGSLLGPQWSLSVGSEESLVEMVDKSVLVTSGNGGQTVFAALFNSKGEPTGKFEAPPGDSNLTMTLEENAKHEKAYYLKDPAAGASTEFLLSSIAKVWIPTAQEGPVPTDTVSYIYETVEVGGKKVTRPAEERGATAVKGLSCAPEGGKIKPGCRALKFTYATKTKSEIGEGPAEWGEYEGRLVKVSYEGYNPATKKMTETPIAVAEYTYDKQGRLRAEWDPRLAPHELKTEYGYDEEGQVTALDPPGQESWVFTYGTIVGDAGTGRLIKVTRAPVSAGLWNGKAVENTEAPKITGTPGTGARLSVSTGKWSNSPVAYSYQWMHCGSPEGECWGYQGYGHQPMIPGATNPTYKPTQADFGLYLAVQVSATNGAGTVSVTTVRTTKESWGLPERASAIVRNGEEGKGTEKLSEPSGITVSENGDVWVSGGEARLQAFKPEKEKLVFQKTFKTNGSETGGSAEAVVASKGDLWIGETAFSGDAHIKEFNEAGTLLKTITLTTQYVRAITVDSNGNIWWINDQEYASYWHIGKYNVSTETTTQDLFGDEKGDFIFAPWGILVNATAKTVTLEGSSGSNGEGSANKHGLLEYSETGTLLKQSDAYKSEGAEIGDEMVQAGEGGLAVDSKGTIWSVSGGNNEQTSIDSSIKGYNAAGEFEVRFPERSPGQGSRSEKANEAFRPQNIAIDASGNIWVTNPHNNKVEEFVNAEQSAEGEAVSPGPGTTIDYNVPVSGTGAPHNMSAAEVAKWGQKAVEAPEEATAIFPADSPQGWPASSYTRATVYYLDGQGRLVNTANPSTGTYGSIATTEYNETNDVVRTLSPDNRATALKEGCESESNCASAKTAKLLSTENTYNGEGEKEEGTPERGTQLVVSRGPEHMVKYVKGEEHYKAGEQAEEAMARSLTKYFYNEGAPTENPRTKKKETYDLVTTTQSFAELINKEGKGGEIVDESETKTSYAGEEDLGWELRAATSVTAAPGSQELTSTSTTEYYEAGEAMGKVKETRTPKGSGGKSAHDQKIGYYTLEADKEYPNCEKHPEWAGLVCETEPAKQPETTGVPNVPVTKTNYNIWNEPETIIETFPKSGSFAEHARTKKDEYDAAGRMKSSEETSTATTETTDKALPKVTEEYNSATGALEKQSTTVGTKTKTITNVYNTLGQLESYTDADGNVAKFKYAGPENDGLLEEMSDSSDEATSNQKYTYSTTTKQLEKLVDSAAGTFTASFDTEGVLASVVYPNGMCANYTDNSVGEATGIEYVKSATCSEKSAGAWFSESKTPSIRGEVMSKTSTLASETYGYDTLGRLTEVHETPAGEYCKTRLYEYEAESNRTKQTTREPNSKKECASEGGTVQEHKYDEANRLIDSEITYDPLGNVTKLPSGDAEGHALESTFYVDNAVATQIQNGVTNNYYMDPGGRVRETITGAKKAITHYDGSGEAVAWTCEGSEKAETCESGGKWTRNIPGIDGTLTAVENGKGATDETPILQLHDLEGDVAATIKDKTGETKLESTYNSTEFGAPNGGKEPPKFAWLGAGGVEKSLASGVITEGATSYVPQIGKALQPEGVDPVGEGGSGGGAPYTSQVEPWVWQGAATSAAEAPGKEAGREREAAEKACEATGEGCEAEVDDPGVVNHLDIGEAESQLTEMQLAYICTTPISAMKTITSALHIDFIQKAAN